MTDYVEKINKITKKYIDEGGHELLEKAERLLEEMKANKKSVLQLARRTTK